MLDEEGVHGDPEPWVDPVPEGGLRLFGRPGPHDPEPVRDPMDVGVDRDRRDPVAKDEDAVRGLRTDPGKRDELVERAGDRAPEPLEELPRARPDHPGLHAVEAGRADERLHLRGAGAGEGRCVREAGEQPGARPVGVRIARPLGKYCPDEHLERVLGVVAQVRPSPVARAVERAQAVEQPFPVERRAGSPSGHRGPLSWEGTRTSGPVAAASPGSERSGSSRSSAPRRSSPIR